MSSKPSASLAVECLYHWVNANLTAMSEDNKFMDWVIEHVNLDTPRQIRLQSDQN